MIVVFFILRFSWASLWSLRLTDENDLGKFCFSLHRGVRLLLDMSRVVLEVDEKKCHMAKKMCFFMENTMLEIWDSRSHVIWGFRAFLAQILMVNPENTL